MYWNEDDSMGFAVYNSSGIIAEAGIPSENKDRIYWDMLDTMFKDSERAETVEAGGTLEAKAQVEVLQRYITTAQANLVLDRLGLEKREELEFIKETMNWIVQTESGFSLQDVDEKLGRARAVMQEGQDGLPVRYEPIAEPDL
ncbi:hypothetical protein FRC08_017576 [Ceratobasidium sp. 394]|nr:hypothetical protein FRC08_017576 [Ceratobasidium sp. 394]